MDNLKINIYPNEIYEIQNFMSDETINHFLSFINLNGDEGWEVFGDKESIQKGSAITVSNHEKRKSFFNIRIELQENIMSYFTNATKILDMTRFSRRKAGEWMPAHRDQGPNSEQDNIKFGAIVYFNDDYEGGELYYKDFDLTIKPKKGSLVIHKSTHLHKVLKVKSGIKYSMTTFIFGDETTFCNIK
jgi:Rps23 Pro-64 3,4-dihydroxylase Tpa1-like proline 4-hydroxylase